MTILAPRVTVLRLPREPGSATERFTAGCACGQTTILHVPVAQALGAATGGFQCDGCGVHHRFAITVEANGGP